MGRSRPTCPPSGDFRSRLHQAQSPDAQGLFLQPQPGGGLRVAGATLKNLIAYAHNVREYAISGGPGWVDSDRFDINARAQQADPQQMNDEQRRIDGQQLRERLKSLLAERFQLQVHRESKQQNVYVLVVARNGPKFGEAKSESRPIIRARRGSIIGQAVSMQMLVRNLANALERPVLDQTHLTGTYDFKLEWMPDDRGPGPGDAQPLGAATPPAADLKRPSIFAALQEQLGLRFESQKAAVELLFIDHAERPSAN